MVTITPTLSVATLYATQLNVIFFEEAQAHYFMNDMLHREEVRVKVREFSVYLGNLDDLIKNVCKCHTFTRKFIL